MAEAWRFFYHLKNKVPDVNLYVNSILKELKKRKVRMSDKALKKLEEDLFQSQTLRADFLKALDLKGQAKKGAQILC